MSRDPLKPLDALSAPMGDLIASVGRGVADAQRALDAASLATYREVYSNADDETFALLREIDYRPTFYVIPEASSTLTVALSIAGESVSGGGPGAAGRSLPRLYAAPVDAGYQNRYNFDIQATSRLEFRVVPVPPSSGAEQLRVAPDLVGKTFAEARARLELFELVWSQDDPDGTLGEPAPEAIVASQSVEPGTLVRVGDSIELAFEPPPA